MASSTIHGAKGTKTKQRKVKAEVPNTSGTCSHLYVYIISKYIFGPSLIKAHKDKSLGYEGKKACLPSFEQLIVLLVLPFKISCAQHFLDYVLTTVTFTSDCLLHT